MLMAIVCASSYFVSGDGRGVFAPFLSNVRSRTVTDSATFVPVAVMYSILQAVAPVSPPLFADSRMMLTSGPSPYITRDWPLPSVAVMFGDSGPMTNSPAGT